MGYTSDAVKYLKKVEKFCPDNLNVKYKLGIVLSDSDPEQAISYLSQLFEKIPQNIDYGVYCSALMKAANIADLDNRPTVAKYYRNKIHSVDLFVKRKVIYRNDLDILIRKLRVKKIFYTYPIKISYKISNVSDSDITHLDADFVLCNNEEPVETVTLTLATRNKPLLIGNYDDNEYSIKFKKTIFTKKELSNYTVKIYAYKDDKFKTLVFENKIPQKSILKSE